MLSREAQNVFWFARYAERAENTARIINVNSNLVLDLPNKVEVGWAPLVNITGGKELFVSLYEKADESSVVRFLASDEANPCSIVNSLRSARENARTVREILPREAWECINSLFLGVKGRFARGLSEHRRFDTLRSVITESQQLSGLLAGTLSHDSAYDFLRIGRDIERADMTTRIIDVRSASLLAGKAGAFIPYENLQWTSVLKSLSAYQMCRRQTRGPIGSVAVLGFLLKDNKFPRSVRHCMLEVKGCIGRLPRREGPLKCVTSTLDALARFRPKGVSKKGINLLMDDYQRRLATLSDEISGAYF